MRPSTACTGVNLASGAIKSEPENSAYKFPNLVSDKIIYVEKYLDMALKHDMIPEADKGTQTLKNSDNVGMYTCACGCIHNTDHACILMRNQSSSW